MPWHSSSLVVTVLTDTLLSVLGLPILGLGRCPLEALRSVRVTPLGGRPISPFRKVGLWFLLGRCAWWRGSVGSCTFTDWRPDVVRRCRFVVMARRGRMASGHSRSNFRQGAKTHRKNRTHAMRGGIRL